jgi:hypothetical protein
MVENPTPRQIVRELLRGIAPPRPLFLPMVFSVGARVENIPLRPYLANPTKIANAQRQIRGPLRSDGVLCYSDPYLEAEALGATIQWEPGDQASSLKWPNGAEKGGLPRDICTSEEAVKSARVNVGIDTIRRLSAMLRDGPLLMASVTGPFTLAARLTQLSPVDTKCREAFLEEALELATSTITKISGAFAEAGANLIFIHEEFLPMLSPESCDAWASLLAPVLNVIRFYESLPVLLMTGEHSLSHNTDLIFQRSWDCVACPALKSSTFQPFGRIPTGTSASLGFALPLNAFHPNTNDSVNLQDTLKGVVSDSRPALLTTAGDVPPATDMKHLLNVLEAVPRSY